MFFGGQSKLLTIFVLDIMEETVKSILMNVKKLNVKTMLNVLMELMSISVIVNLDTLEYIVKWT